MSLDLQNAHEIPVTLPEDLIRYFREAEKPIHSHRIGLEHEKLLFPLCSASPVAY